MNSITNNKINEFDMDQYKNIINQNIKYFSENFKNILFIEPYGATISLLLHAVKKNYNVIILTANQDLRIVNKNIKKEAKLTLEIDTANASNVLELIHYLNNKITLHAVVPGFEYFVPLAAEINDYLSLPGTNANQIMKLRNKNLMRDELKKAGVNIPNYVVVNSISQLYNAITSINLPAVCKPIDAAGSVNVKRVNDQAEAISAAIRILKGNDKLWGHKISTSLLVEEFISGKEFSVEGVVNNGQIKFFSITEKFVSDEFDFIEIGHIVNPPLDVEIKNKIINYIEKVISVLKPNYCPFHAEIRIRTDGQPVLIEIAARLPGDKIGDLINLSCNQNYFDEVLRAYLNEPSKVENEIDYHSIAGIRFFYRANTSLFNQITGIEEASKLPIEDLKIYYSHNAAIPDFPKPLRRLGHVIMKSNDYCYLTDTLKKIDNIILFH